MKYTMAKALSDKYSHCELSLYVINVDGKIHRLREWSDGDYDFTVINGDVTIFLFPRKGEDNTINAVKDALTNGKYELEYETSNATFGLAAKGTIYVDLRK